MHSDMRTLFPMVMAMMVMAIAHPSTACAADPAPGRASYPAPGHAADRVRANDTTPPRATEESVLLSNTRQLIYEGKRSGEGYWSSDGTKVIFQSERQADNPFYQIYTLDFNSGEVSLVSTGLGKTTCAWFDWSSGDKRILFSSTHADPASKSLQEAEIAFRASGQTRRYSWDYDPRMDIFTANADGSDLSRVTDALGYDAEASFSPDGRHIAFSSTRSAFEQELSAEDQRRLEVDPSYFGEIYIMDRDGGNVRRLTNTPGYDGGPFFSPDGKRIIWRRFNESGYTADIYSMDINGGDVRRITDFASMSWAPYYHPSGEYVIFGSNKMGFTNFELYIVDAEGKREPQRVTFTEGFDSLPVFSPDGRRLLWTSTRTSNRASQLFLADWKHEAARELLRQAPMRGEGSVRFSAEVSPDEMRAKVEFLASDELEGRMTGSEGIRKASEYLIKSLIEIGSEPLAGSYRHPFEYVAGIDLADGNGFKVAKVAEGAAGAADAAMADVPLGTGYMPLPFSTNGSIDAEIVFAGYGLTAPQELGLTYDDYGSLDVTGKVVLVLDGMPGFLTEEQERTMLRYATPRYKAFQAKERGAVGILFIDERERPYSGPRNERTAQQAGILAAEVKAAHANAWFAGVSGIPGMPASLDVDALKAAFESLNPHAQTSFSTGMRASLSVQLETRMGQDENIIAVIPANGAAGNTPGTRTILLGAHLDHLGYGETGSRASGDAAGTIHNGADDNASGTAMILELAEHLAEMEARNPGTLRYNIAIAFWSGEELGLIGSSEFTKGDAFKDLDVAAYLNFDMVGMLNANQLILQGLGSSSGWRQIVEKKNFAAGFQLSLSDDPYVPTDGMALYQAGVPILCFFTGLHDHYHMPSDDAGNLDYDGMKRIADYALQILLDLNASDPLAYETVQMNPTRAGSMRGFTVYLGTIPDYAATGKGVKLSGVREGGPAEKAGLKAGDVIVSMGGRTLNDLYDYTYALSDLKPGVEIEVIVERDGATVTLKLVPEAR
jgi:hypothetical protein